MAANRRPGISSSNMSPRIARAKSASTRQPILCNAPADRVETIWRRYGDGMETRRFSVPAEVDQDDLITWKAGQRLAQPLIEPAGSSLMDHGRDDDGPCEHHKRDHGPFRWPAGPALNVAILVPPTVTVVIPQAPADNGLLTVPETARRVIDYVPWRAGSNRCQEAT
jgi:hypothetical protein